MNILFYIIYQIVKYLPATNTSPNVLSRIIRFVRSRIGGLLLKNNGNLNIEKGADFGMGKEIFVGRNCGIGINCSIRGPLVIGDDLMMGPNVTILTRNHKIKKGHIYSSTGSIVKGVFIGNNVWIGCNVIILPGVKIGNNSVIGAGAVVTKSFGEYSFIAGNPAILKKFIE